MNKTQPICSVCIANYNGIDVIHACIESVLSQGWGESVEIIIHDDASTDKSVNYIMTHYPSIRLIKSTENVGFCIANNRMTSLARGQYLLLLNNDAELMPNALNTLLEGAGSMDKEAILGLPQYEASTGKLLDRGSLLDPFLNPVPNRDAQRHEVGMIMGACLWIPTQLWIKLGGFPEWFGSIGEDLFLCCQARLWGYPVRCLEQSGYLHHVGNSFGGGKVTPGGKLLSTKRRRGLSERNKTFVMIMTMPTPMLYLLLPVHILLLVLEGAFMTVSRLDMDIWKSIYMYTIISMSKERHRLLAHRKMCQLLKNINLIEFSRVFSILPYKFQMLLRHGIPELR